MPPPRRPRSTLALAVAAVLAGGAAAPAAAQPVAYALDPAHSFITFEVMHFNTATLRGRFGPVDGQVLLDRTARSGRVQVVLDMASLSTGVPLLDARLKQPDLFSTAAHPQAFFVAERLELDAAGGVLAAAGELTLRGGSQPLRLVAQRFRCYPHPVLQQEVCGGDFEATLYRSALGMGLGLPFVADRVLLKVQVEALRQPP